MMKKTANKLRFIFLFVVAGSGSLFAQSDTTLQRQLNRKRLNTFVVTGGLAYSATLIGLSQLWYKDNPRQSFTFFNDNAEWKQVDKVGHLYSAFYLSYGTANTLRWAGLPRKKATILGAVTGFLVLAPIELLDGFSEAYGASAGDLIANASGAALFLAQSAIWDKPRIYPKFSFHRTSYASIRPAVLGNGLVSEGLKDYNGQTYWLSFDMDKFLRFPKWLNFAIGYGAENFIYARDWQNRQLGYDPYRQYYFSIDIDLTSIRSHSKVVKALLSTASLIKLPFPTLEFSRQGTRFHIAYF